MARTRIDAAKVRDAECDWAEAKLAEAMERVMRGFLARIRTEAALALRKYGDVSALTAAANPLPKVPFDLFTSAEVAEWWDYSLGQDLWDDLSEIWATGFHNEKTISTGLDDLPLYLSAVKDRLVPGTGPMLSPSIPEDAFLMARGVITRAIATGDSPEGLARQLAATFSWDKDQAYWETYKADALAGIDEILDPIGPPGDPARELAKRTNPAVIALRQDANLAQSKIDAATSTWQARATRIARTESTGALNAGALSAMAKEGVQKIEWVATLDGRTRPSHRRMDGQTTELGTPFPNGLLMPGDPSGPAREVVNCRCAVVAAKDDPVTLGQPADEPPAPLDDAVLDTVTQTAVAQMDEVDNAGKWAPTVDDPSPPAYLDDLAEEVNTAAVEAAAEEMPEWAKQGLTPADGLDYWTHAFNEPGIPKQIADPQELQQIVAEWQAEIDAGFTSYEEAKNAWGGALGKFVHPPKNIPDPDLTIGDQGELPEWAQALLDSVVPQDGAFLTKEAVEAVAESRAALERRVRRVIADETEARAVAASLAQTEAEAKAYAKMVKKWKGKPAPKAPKPPVKPEAKSFARKRHDAWLERVKADYNAFLDANPQFTKKTLEQSNNWGYFEQIINGLDSAADAVQYLSANNYLSPSLVAEALDNIAFGRTAKGAQLDLDPEAKKQWKRDRENYGYGRKVWEKNLAEWRLVNGDTLTLSGMEGATTWGDIGTAKQWVRDFLRDPEGTVGRDTLPNTPANALHIYTGGDYRTWNGMVRAAEGDDSKLTGHIGDQIRRADRGMTPLPEDIIVHRGDGYDAVVFPDGSRQGSFPPPPITNLIGTVQTQWSFTSTSVAPRAAFYSKPIQWVIRVPKGTPAAYLDNITQVRGENELLLGREQHLFIHDAYRGPDGKWTIEAEVLPPGVDPATFAQRNDLIQPFPKGTDLGDRGRK